MKFLKLVVKRSVLCHRDGLQIEDEESESAKDFRTPEHLESVLLRLIKKEEVKALTDLFATLKSGFLNLSAGEVRNINSQR